jgi:cold shock CspA family protein
MAARQSQPTLTVDVGLGERTVMAEQRRAIVCQRCGMGFVVTENYLSFLAKWGNELVEPVQCLSCFWKGGPVPKQEGHIKWFSKRKRYGFIVTQEQEIFFHQNQLVDSDGTEPIQEQSVRFHTRYTSKGREALNVELINN